MLKEILKKFFILHDVKGVIIIRENGEIIERINSGIHYDDTFMKAVSLLMVGSKATADDFGHSPISMVFMEFSEYFVLLLPLKEEFFLLIIAENSANIGQITYEMKKNKEDITALL
jgi:predicted regulator of Ras-like GTPase activity (Roadblock/LC7/MglB family)